MKRILALFFAALVTLSLFSCQESVTDPTGESVEIEPDMLGPLFRIRAAEEQSTPETKYYATESGIAYVSRTDKGYMGGYFMLPNLISNEEIFTSASEPSEVFDLGEEKAAVFADGKLILLSLEQGSSTSYHLSGKMAYSDLLLGADSAFYYETEDYLLTAQLSFSEDYSSLEVTEQVVMPKNKIEGYTGLLGVSADGERLYYTYEEQGRTGYAYFGIGYRAEMLGKTEREWKSFQRISGTSLVLFESLAKDGEISYTLVDFDSGEEKTVRVSAGGGFSGVTVNRTGTHLVGYLADSDGLGGYLDLYAFENAKRLKHYELAELKVNPSLAATLSAKYLIVGQYDDGTAYEDSGGETVTMIEVAY